jgi:oligopeptidase B
MTDQTPPVAARHPVTHTHHGISHTDDYAWLRDAEWQKVMHDPQALDAEIRAYLEAENAYTAAVLAPLSEEIEALFQEMKGRIKADDSSVPLPDGPFAYYRRFRDGGEHPLICRQPRDGEAETLMLDGDAEAEGKAYFKLSGCEHSPDHRLLAYTADYNGAEIYTLKLRELATGTDLADVIEGISGGFEWAPDSRAIYYTVLDDNHRPCAVRRHVIGTAPADDEEIYRESDPGFFVGISTTESRRFILIDVHDSQTSEVRILDTENPDAGWRLIAARQRGHDYDVSHWQGELLIRTNIGDAEDFKVVAAPIDAPGPENWRDVAPHEAGRLVIGIQAFADHWVRLERVNALPRLVVTGTDGKSHAIEFDEAAYSLGLGGSYEYATTTLRFTYSSMTTPERTYDYDMATRERSLMKEQEVPSGHDPADYVTRRILASARDGETVPVSLLYRADTPLDGDRPVLLYGYGSYGISIPAAFSVARLGLADRGFVFAIAHIRGGMDKGYRWYRDGRVEKKTNTFYDFIDVAKALVAEGITKPGRIAAHGGSAGGMLMGAVANMAPELFGAILADVPFVDVLNTMLDDTLPLTPLEWPEWGDPITDADAYRRIAGYSPYDNVTWQDYPAMYIAGGLTDPRVTYWEPAKWAAKLRASKTDDNVLCLKVNMEAGHGGAAGRYQRLLETAEQYAFAVSILSR